MLQLCGLIGFAETIIVTNNANSGVGSLREALTKASENGITTQDIIEFNLPDRTESGRTITLLSELPDVTSNLIIDGATQPGSFYGVSTAKVHLVTAFNSRTSNYGLILRNVE